MENGWWMILPGNPVMSGLLLFAIAVPFLYFARTPMHGLITSLTLGVSGPLRLGSRWLMSTAAEMRERNQTVLMAHGREEVTQAIEREFERVSKLVQRDLHGYPALQRKLIDEITHIEEDYQKCGEVPPPTPEWTKAIETIARIKPSGDGLVEKLLEDISVSIEKIHDKSLSQHRKSYEKRHKILKGFMPFWRSLNSTMKRVDSNFGGLQESASKIDAQMDKYEKIVAKSEKAEQMLTSSAAVQFFISTAFLSLLFGGAFVNYKLVALPMSEMVGGGDYITASLKASEVAALVIILLEVSVGLFLMEALRLTHLFPRINNLSDMVRGRLKWAAIIFLFVFAGIEVALAFMRDSIVASNLSVKQALGGGDAAVIVAAQAKNSMLTQIPMFGQMVLGFILPWVLALVGVPLEYFVYSGRTVLGVIVVASTRTLAFILRALSNTVRHISKALIMFYDVVIFLPLIVERALVNKKSSEKQDFTSTITSFHKRRAATGEQIL
ncbi:MAG: hypothetical protein BMS9Abin36_1495 [Gammaproteobacteria bacterium]|nr:MAG: hypothetical protein BMS9Abin36_1495 [Gammaproteobacteria bacterium]